MKYVIGALIATIFWMIVLALVPMPDETIRLYDCSMAEWHPDIPKEVKEECRKRRMQVIPKGINT